MCPNTTSVNSAHLYQHTKSIRWSVAFVLGIVAAATLVVNGYVILKIIRKKRHKLFTRFFLLSLTFSDILVGITVMPISISGLFFRTNELLGAKTCEIVNSFDFLSTSTSILHLSILTFERYVAICRTFDYDKYFNKKTTLLLSLFCWSIVIVFSFGLIVPGYSSSSVDDCNTECLFAPNIYYSIVATIIFLLMPVILITMCNISVWIYVIRRKAIRKQCSTNHQQHYRLDSRNIRVTKTIATLTGCFLICWAPFIVATLLSIFSVKPFTKSVMFVFIWLGYLNSAVNPILYLLLEGKTCIGRG